MASIFKKLFSSRRNENYNRGIALYNEKNYDEAIDRFETALGEVSKSSATFRLSAFYIAESHANIGRAQLKAENYEEAGRHLDLALQENPNFPDLHYNRGVTIFMVGAIEDAQPFFERALEINPEYVEARCFLAVAMHALGKEDEAREHLKQVTDRPNEIPIQASRYLLVNLKERETLLPEIGPVLELLESSGEFREIYSEGISNYNLGRFSLAVDLLRRAVGMKPHYADLQCQLGLALFKAERNEEAVKAFQGALTVNPRFLEAAYFMGVTLLRERRYLEAEEALSFAKEIRDDSCDIHFHLAQCKFHLGKLDEADAFLDDVLERKPNFPQAAYLRGLVRYELGRHDEGIELLRKALGEHPHLQSAEKDLALMYLDQGDFNLAENIFSHLSELDGDDECLLCFRGQAFLGQGMLDEALKDFSNALQLVPDNLYALKGRLRCEVKLGRNSKAQALIAPYLERHPDYPDLRKIQGDIHFRMGDHENAEADYRRALELAPGYLEAELGLALSLRNQGRAGEAGDLLRGLLEKHPDNVHLRQLLKDSFVDLDDMP